MNHRLLLLACLLLLPLPARSETYRWTDDGGQVQFTDNLASVPARYRNRLEVGEDITLDNPAVREEVAQRRQLAAELERQEQAASRQRQEERRVQEGRERADQAERTRATRQAQARGAGKSSRVAGPSPVNPEKVSLTSTRHQRTKAPT